MAEFREELVIAWLERRLVRVSPTSVPSNMAWTHPFLSQASVSTLRVSECDSGEPCPKALHNQGAGKKGRADTFPQPPSPLASRQTLLRRAPSHLPGSTTADAWRSHGKVTATTLGNQLPGSSLPSQVPSFVLAEREGRTNRLSLQSDRSSGFKS